jgi:hypothetical protein
MGSLLKQMHVLERRITVILRSSIEKDEHTKSQQKYIATVRLACNELKLDIRDYEYAETKAEQQKWARIAKHNVLALQTSLMALDTIFSAVDIAELSAKIELLEASLV